VADSSHPTAPAADVIIINYRSYDELDRCLASIQRDRSRVNRVVIVDHDCDTASATRIATRYPWAELVERSTNEGFATGVNIGARLTNGEFFLIVNPDCTVSNGAFGRLIDFVASRPDTAIVAPRILNADGTIQGSARRFPGFTTVFAGRSSWLTKTFPRNPLSRMNLPALDAGQEPVDADWVSGACMVVRRAAFEQAGGMDENFFLYWEDADLCRRLWQRGWRTTYLPGPTVVHMGGRSSIHAYRDSLVAFHASAFKLFRKHATWPSKMLTPLVYLGLQLRLLALLSLRRQ
jgi:GT2 family glycosyltransferase